MSKKPLPVVAETADFLKELARRQKNPDVARRLLALYQIAAGIAKNKAGIARSLGCDPTGLGRWLIIYENQGLDAYMSDKKRGPKLCAALRRPDVYSYLLGRLSDEKTPPASFKALRFEVLGKFPDISYTYEGFHRALNRVFPGVSLKVPRKVHPKQAPGAVEEFKKKASPRP